MLRDRRNQNALPHQTGGASSPSDIPPGRVGISKLSRSVRRSTIPEPAAAGTRRIVTGAPLYSPIPLNSTLLLIVCSWCASSANACVLPALCVCDPCKITVHGRFTSVAKLPHFVASKSSYNLFPCYNIRPWPPHLP